MTPFPIGGTFDEQTAWWIDNNREVDNRAIAAGQAAKPITTWAEVAAFVDGSTWERILDDLGPASRAEAVKARPSRTQRHLSVVPDSDGD